MLGSARPSRARFSSDTRWVLSLLAILTAELLYFNLGVSSFWGGG